MGHVIQIEDSRMPNHLLYGEHCPGKQKRSRPRKRFKDCVKASVARVGIAPRQLEHCAQDRLGWCALSRQAHDSFEGGRRASITEARERRKLRNKTEAYSLHLIFQFLPSLTITFFNNVVPGIFNVLVSLEGYLPAMELKITLIRTMFVRLCSLGVLTFTLYLTLLLPTNRPKNYCEEEKRYDARCCGNFLWNTANGSTKPVLPQKSFGGNIMCWETYVGQQFYKLAIVDFGAFVAQTFFLEFPRKFIYDSLKEKYELVMEFGQQDFDISKNVLDIVYTQVLSCCSDRSGHTPVNRLGRRAKPDEGMTFIKLVMVFYMKRLTLLKNFAPPQYVYKVSRSNSFFNIILLISFILVGLSITNMVGTLYSTEDYVFLTSLSDVISDWPGWASSVVFFFGTTTFIVPCFVVLCLLIYHYWAVGKAYKTMEKILRHQLKGEARDRQFLLARVNEMIQQGDFYGFDGDAVDD
ncbi:transmembrane channel-like protein 7 [Babylonia areolata]|uniref:transmembrane channel-like protein 7 n=1 Tax=Babylonia areolata TaxID=304850 RepID=UPI003FCF2C62